MRNLIFSLSLFSIGIVSFKTTFGSIASDEACDGNYSDSSISNNNTSVVFLEIGYRFDCFIEEAFDFSIEEEKMENNNDVQQPLLQLNEKNIPAKEKLSQVDFPHFHLSLMPHQFPAEGTFAKNKSSNNNEISAKKKLFQCKICGKCFKNKYNFKTHERVHTGEKPFQCEICHKRFKRKSNLNQHERIHTGEKPFQCEVCHKSFNQSSSFIKHKRVHTGERPFQCEICHKSFKQSSHLTTHERIHRGEKPFQCSICLRCFTLKGNLKKHIGRHSSKGQIKD